MSANAAVYNMKIVPCHAGNQTASSNGKSIDALGYETVTALYQFGTTTTGTSGTVTLSLEDSADDNTFTAISGATTAALTTDTGGQDAKRYAIVVSGKFRRYVRLVLTKAGTVATGATGPLNNGAVLIASNGPTTLGTAAYDGVTHAIVA